MSIAAIETEYAGCRFRSRLEARWAVFFDRLRMKWRYEEQGYELADGTRYLPDFYLPDQAMYVEVKGPDEALHAAMPTLLTFVKEADEPLVILGEVPACSGPLPMHPSIGIAAGRTFELACILSQDRASKWVFTQMLAVGPLTTGAHYFKGIEAGRVLADAYNYARSARFEHGETPSPRGESR